MNAPLISVIVPAYNAQATLLDTITSIRCQTFSDFELIVIDDGSTDATLERLQDAHDPRLRVFSYPNAGLAAARNRGIEQARGEFISFIDSDDLWTPDKLEMQLAALRARSESGLAYSWTAFLDEAGRFLFAKEPSRIEGDVYADLATSCFVASGSNILVRRSCLDQVGGFDESLRAAQDWDFCLRVAARWPFALVPRYQILYRISESAMSANAERCEEACLIVRERAFRSRPSLPHRRRDESLSNLKQYISFLYLSRATGVDFRRAAGDRLAECVRLYPRTLLRQKTWNLLLAWSLLQFLPARSRRAAVTTLLKWYGRWLTVRRREVRELREKLPLLRERAVEPADPRDGARGLRSRGPRIGVWWNLLRARTPGTGV